MSLLMEALRKAEQAKRSMQQQEEAARGGSGAYDDPSPPASSFTLEERAADVTPQALESNSGDAAPGELLEESVYPDEVAEHAQYAAQRQRAAAASVFAAKRKPATNRKTLAILVATMLLIVPVGGGILWYLQSANTSSIGLNPALANYDLSSRRFDDAATDTAPAVPDTNPVAPAPVVAEPAVDAIGAEEVDATDDIGTAVADTPRASDEVAPIAAPALEAPSNSSLALPTSTSPPVLEITRSRAAPQVNPNLTAAYARLQEGDIAGAGTLYRQVLAALPNNRDALLGLALVHMREGEAMDARALYARLLDLNPRDPLAHTGLLQVTQSMQSGSPAEHENALKALIGQFPNVAQLTLALGNHYAAQGRWSEAQAAYYNALLTARRGANGPVHPDYAFNLAVSLEQLNQPQAALDYYRQAQALAAEVTPGFDPEVLDNRLDYLLSEQAPR